MPRFSFKDIRYPLIIAWLILPASAYGLLHMERHLTTNAQHQAQVQDLLDTIGPNNSSDFMAIKDAMILGQNLPLNHEPARLPSPGGQVLMRFQRDLQQQKIRQQVAVHSLPLDQKERVIEMYKKATQDMGMVLTREDYSEKKGRTMMHFNIQQSILRVMVLERPTQLSVVVELNIPFDESAGGE